MNRLLRAHIKNLLAKGKRLDNRTPLDYMKDIKIEYNISKSAEGSAKVTIGDTIVLAGIKMEVMTPYGDAPDVGSLMVGAELLPMSNPDFEPGPPSIQAIEMARVLDRAIRESQSIDFKKLCIESGEKAWMVIIDIITINDAGNLFDAASIASLAALKNARMPKYEDGVIDYKTLTDDKIPMVKMPVTVTIHKIGEHFIVDPLPEEEEVSDSRISIGSTEDGKLCSMQKGGEAPMTAEDLDKAVDIAMEKANELRALVKGE